MAKQDLQDKKKRKTCSFCAEHVNEIDYKDASKFSRIAFMNSSVACESYAFTLAPRFTSSDITT